MQQTIRTLLCLAAITGSAAATATTYSPGGWPTLHADAGNRRAVETRVLSRHYTTWQALAGATVLTAPTTSPDGRQMYVTTGLSQGHSNLYAFSIDGKRLWQAAPWRSPSAGVDPCALLSSPIVDAQGVVYLSDCNQVFAFAADGKVLWTTDLPAPQPGDWVAAGGHPVNAFTTAGFTVAGQLFGVTNFGDVVILDRHSGNILNAPYRLPGLLPPYADKEPLPDSLWGNDLIDPHFRKWAWQLLFGGSMRSANTPAVARSGRIFVVGSAATKGQGALYGLDVAGIGAGLSIEQAFATGIGLGSGSSPALSPAEDRVYVSDEEGWLYGIDALGGAVIWKVKTRAAAGAVAVGGDGTVYALQARAPAVIAVDAQGRIKWESDCSELARAQLPVSALLGEPVAVGNGNPTVTADAVLVPVTYGYHVPLLGFTAPVRSAVVALDLHTGKALRNLVSLPDDSSGVTAVLPDGTLISSLGAALTSAVSPLKLVIDLLLPQDLQMLGARGGVQVALPTAD